MANAMRRIGNFLGLMDDTEMETSVVEVPRAQVAPRVSSATTPEVRIRPRVEQPVRVVSSPVESAPEFDLPNSYRIITLQPRSYNEARTIGEHYRQGNPVIINLDDMEEAERKRLVDFASGLVFGLHGTIERVSLKVFLLSPANVNVSTEDKTAAAQASFFNQS